MHLSQHFLSVKKVEEIKKQRESLLKVKGIQDDNLCDQFFVSDFVPNGGRPIAGWIEEITLMYKDIAAYSIAPVASSDAHQFAFSRKRVELQEGTYHLDKLNGRTSTDYAARTFLFFRQSFRRQFLCACDFGRKS